MKERKGGQSADSVWRGRDALQPKALLGVRFLIAVYIVHCAMNILAPSFPPLNIFFSIVCF